jgi:polyisoprenoid-binding protein YceI
VVARKSHSLNTKGKYMSVLSSLPAGSFVIDASHSRVGFSARHAMVTKVRGSFNEFTGSATVADGSASINVDINAASVDTRSAESRWTPSVP